MHKSYAISFAITVAIAVLLFTGAPTALAAEVPLITKEELKPIMDEDNLIILDVRTGRDWNSSEFKIKGAQRVDAKKVTEWASNYKKDNKLVIYCA